MASKFIRQYRLTIEPDEGEAIVIENDLTVNFNIQRSTMATLNSMQLSIYNLGESARRRIFQDRFKIGNYKRVILQAGYDSLSTVFIGNIFQANSFREGTEVVTLIDARDGGFDTTGTVTSQAIDGGTLSDVIKALAGDFEHVKVGTVNADGEFRRPLILNGNNFELIKKYAGDKAFIDLEELNVLKENDVISGDVPLITSETGLLSTPRRDDAYLTIDTIFEPRIVMGQVLEVQSSIAPEFDGQYKVIGVTHNATISGAVGGEAKSTFQLLVGSQLFGGFNEL